METFSLNFTEIEVQQTNLKAIQEKMAEITHLSEVLKDNVEDYKIYSLKGQAIIEKQTERKSFEGASVTLKNATSQLDSLEKQKTKKKDALSKELEKCSKALSKLVSLETIQPIYESVKSDLINKISALDTDIERINGNISVLQQKKGELEENLKKFLAESETKVCPTCQTELTHERIEQLISIFSTELKESVPEIQKLKTELVTVKREKTEIIALKAQVDSIDPENTSSLTAELAETISQIEEKKAEIEGLKKQAEALLALDAEVSKLEEEKGNKEEAYREYDSAKRQLAKMPAQEDLESRMGPINTKIGETSARLNASIRALGYEPKEPQKELKALREKKEIFDQNFALAGKKNELESDLAKLSKELSNCQEERSKTEQAFEIIEV